MSIGDDCQLAHRVVVKRGTLLGAENVIHEGAVIGGVPQHLRAGSNLGELHIGDRNTIRENVTIHRSVVPGEATRVGSGNLIMVNAHIAHDCQIGNQTIIANNVMLAGHITVRDYAYLSGAVGVHQFCRIGQYAIVGGQAHIKQDVPPYVTVDGRSSLIVGLNLIGLHRHAFSPDDIAQLKAAYRLIYRSGLNWTQMLQALERQFVHGPAAEFHAFLSGGQRGFIQERRASRGRNDKVSSELPSNQNGDLRRAA